MMLLFISKFRVALCHLARTNSNHNLIVKLNTKDDV